MGYKIAKFSQSKYRFQLYDNVDRLTWQQIQQKTGCAALCNLWYFKLLTYEHDTGVMLEGNWVRSPEYDWPGMCIDKDGHVTTGGTADAVWDYAASVQADYTDGKRTNTTHWPEDGVTYTGLTAQGDVVILLSPEDSPMDSEEAVQAMLDAGCTDILRWDGSWSSQGSLGPGMDVQPSQKRICRGWLLVFEKNKEEKPVSDKKIVCLDPGHGPDTVNGSPDGTYKEHEFAWDMGQRVKALLEAQGVEAVVTRTADTKPTLTDRAAVSNSAGADCLVSLHTNAEGGTGWGSARGLMIYTSAGPTNAPRNVLAQDIIDRIKENGVLVRSTPIAHDISLTVLVKADAPACLIEYGFHTNREDVALLKDSAYRDTLAEATAHGICDWLGVTWSEPETPEAPTAEQPADWAAEAWAWAKAMGLMDGTRPTDNNTRQEAAVELKRLYEAIKAGK